MASSDLDERGLVTIDAERSLDVDHVRRAAADPIEGHFARRGHLFGRIDGYRLGRLSG